MNRFNAWLAGVVFLGAAQGQTHAMQFEVRSIQNSSPPHLELVMSGRVEGNELSQLKDWIEKNPTVDTVILKNSNGGDAATGYAVGEYIRSKGLATGVAGHCLSSCSRMFLGGKRRFFTDEFLPEKTMVGFHGNYRSDGSLSAERLYYLKQWVMEHMDWDDAKKLKYQGLVEQWVNTPNHHGFMYFYNEEKFKTPDGASVIYCNGSEPRQQRLELCEHKLGIDSKTLGVSK